MTFSLDFLRRLQLLISTPSVVGSEHGFFMMLKRELETMGVFVTLYEGILEAKGSRESSVILCSHVDRNGLICTGPNEFQYASHTTRFQGDLDGKSRSEQFLTKIQHRFKGEKVLAYDPRSGAYQGQGVIQSSTICPKRHNLIFTVNGLENLLPGTPVAYNSALNVDGNWIRSQLDNVLSVAVILTLYERGYKGRALFTCEEEAGRSWRYLLSYFQRKEEKTDSLLVLDTSPFETTHEAKSYGVVLRNKDVYAPFNANLTDAIEAECQRHAIAYCKKDVFIMEKNRAKPNSVAPSSMAPNSTGANSTDPGSIDEPISIGATELGRLIIGSRSHLSGTTFQFPTCDYHTSYEGYYLPALEGAMSVLEAVID